MNLSPPYQWKRLSNHLDRDKALRAYGKQLTPAAPSGRYGATSVIKDNQMYLFGGTDGGYHKHGRDGFEQGYDYDELWAMNLQNRRWHFLGSNGSA